MPLKEDQLGEMMERFKERNKEPMDFSEQVTNG